MGYDIVPSELRQLTQWVTWRYELHGKPASKNAEGATKIPYNAYTGHKASSNNPNTWAPFDVAVKAAANRKHSGIGFVFSENDPYTGIDLDDCLSPDGTLESWAREIVDTMSTYTEISPSGSGVKMWVIGEIPTAIKTPQLEMYFKVRYFTVTGQRYDSTPTTIRSVNGELTHLYEQYKKEDTPPTQAPTAHATVGSDHATEWARKKLADAIRMVALASDGVKHDTLLDAGRLAGGAVPHVSEWEIETALYAAIEGRAADKRGARKTIQDGIRLGMSAPLPIPEPPPQPTFDADGFACCPTHARRLNPSKNGNGYKCRERDASTPNGWCDFWWKGDGYIAPQPAEPVIIAGELITQSTAPAVQGTPRYTLYNLGGLRALPPVTWLVEGEIPEALTTIVCGPSGAGKSFLMVDYAMRVARANPDRIVVYIAPEGGSGYHMRTQAWLNHFGGDEPDNLLFILQAIPLLNPQAVSDLITTIRPFYPVMVVIDTLARCLVGGDENSAKDVGMFFYHTDMIRQETGAAITIVHHTGKSGGGYRGSSVLYGSVESWIDVANDDGLITVSCGKSKDAKPFPPRYLRMVESAESVVLMPSDQVSQRNAVLTEGQRKVLETLALEIFKEAGARRAELVSATGINDLTIFKVLSRLKKDGLINQSKKGDPYFLSDSGRDAIVSYHRELRNKRQSDQLATSTRLPNAQLATSNSDQQISVAQTAQSEQVGQSQSIQLANNRSLPNAQLANSQPTSNQLATSGFHQLATSNPPYIYKGVLLDGSSDQQESELFPDEPKPTAFRPMAGYDEAPAKEPNILDAIPSSLRMTTRMMLASDKDENQATAKERCEMYGIDFDAARAAVRGAGKPRQE